MNQVTHAFNAPRFFSVTLAALSASLVMAGAAHASPANDAPSVRIAYGDLNLTSDAGTQALYGRIVSAAREVCDAQQVDNRDLHAVALERRCENQAIAAAVSSVHSARLATLSSLRVEHG